MTGRRGLLAGLAAFVVCGPACGQSGGLSPREAFEALRAGRIVLVDIRNAAEQADTGVPSGALRLDAEAAGFELRLAGLRVERPGARIVLIDRTGGQAETVRRALAGRGWRDLGLVAGGMLGPAGWLAEKLPVEP